MSIHPDKRRPMLERWKSETEIVRKAIGNAVEPKNPIPVRELSMHWVDVEILLR
jgi:hypothetical protein